MDAGDDETAADDDDADDRIASRVLAGDGAAFRTLVERHQAAVFGLLSAILPRAPDREDVAQEAFLAAWRRLDTFDPARGSFAGWLLVIARNRALNALRRRGSGGPAPLAERPEPPATEGGAPPPGGGAVGDLDEALASLSPERRTAFVLSEVHGLPLAEVARIEDVPLGTVKSRVARAREDLRAALASSPTPAPRLERLP